MKRLRITNSFPIFLLSRDLLTRRKKASKLSFSQTTLQKSEWLRTAAVSESSVFASA